MNSKFIAGLALACIAFTACDDSTDSIGSSLAEANDGVSIQTATFDVFSRSIPVDSVLSRNPIGYLGKVKDPETGVYVTGDFMAQFNSLDDYQFPNIDSLITYDANGNMTLGSDGTIKADSCELRLFFEDFYGDSTQTMKLTAYEMSKTMNEDRLYYSNFDPIANGYVRTDGIHQDKVYNLVDYNVAEDVRDTSTYWPYITIKLNSKYTDTSGKTYNNYGAYVLQKYYDDPSNFKNAYSFRNKVVPGFFFKMKSGLGNMASINGSQLNVYFKYKSKVAYTDSVNGTTVTAYKDTIYNGVTVFWGTEEVLQTTTITNDQNVINKLAADESCTYLKTPAGIFTELTLPVDDIMSGHTSETITSAQVVLQRINNSVQSDYAFDVPDNVLMIPEDSLYSFFEHNNLYDNITSYLTSWGYSATGTSTGNSYTFHNISGLITAMYNSKATNTSSNWNKVVIIPVTLTTTSSSTSSSSSSTTSVTKVSNNMGLTSTRLVKGTNTDSPIQISVIYSRFK
ncbi:MAG: DUF4270 domain-containing protein [Prevotella sp.]|nr:DUF4270 domain-containing protein [Prevotella sp.]